MKTKAKKKKAKKPARKALGEIEREMLVELALSSPRPKPTVTPSQMAKALSAIEQRCLSEIERHRRTANDLREYYSHSGPRGCLLSVIADCREVLSRIEAGGA